MSTELEVTIRSWLVEFTCGLGTHLISTHFVLNWSPHGGDVRFSLRLGTHGVLGDFADFNRSVEAHAVPAKASFVLEGVHGHVDFCVFLVSAVSESPTDT